MSYLVDLNSLWDEETWGSDSLTRSSLYKVQQGQVSFGQVSSFDTVDWYALDLLTAGSYEVVISNDSINNYGSLNLWSTSLSGVRVELTDAYGTVISTVGSATAFGAFDGVLALTYSGGYSSGEYFLKVTNLGYSDADYAVTLRYGYVGGGSTSSVYGTSGPDTLTGTVAAEEIYGYGGDDVLIGEGGDDTLDGGTGYDLATYFGADGAVFVNLATGQSSGSDGIDTLISIEDIEGSSYSDRLTGDSTANWISGLGGNDTLAGGAGNDLLRGEDGNDSLDGGSGADKMLGGAGDDTYTVDNLGDLVYETTTLDGTTNAGGTDTVRSSVSLTLGSFVEKLVLTGSATINGSGNTLANTLTGNSAANTLSGGSGADTMLGGAGNDTYVVDNVGDRVYETTTVGGTTDAGGIDTVRSSVSYSLGSFVEKLGLTGSGTINGTGNKLANSLTGNAAANTLNGGTGADTMLGGAGNDTYVVDNLGDRVYETTTIGGTTNAGGIDTVRSGVSFTLGSFVEKLVLTGSATINGTGNALANTITGNGANNRLSGGSGNDSLNGGAGNDTLAGGTGHDSLTGGTGQDAFRFDTALSVSTNVDRIADFVVVDDTIQLENAVFTSLATTGTLAGGRLRIGAAAADSNEFVIYNPATGALSYDADGSGAAFAAVQFALLGTGLVLTVSDFFIT